ncbi:MAG: 4Fe-4S binding protein [Rhodobacteraceae bacterium]|nr:4Fe-4S binding protein [Paracoccaceae bacterium]
MADLSVEFSGVKLKNPIIVASAEPSNSVENIKKCIDFGAGAVITKTIGDIPGMQQLTKNSKYAILNDQGKIIKGKVPRSFVFYSRSGFISEPAQDWVSYLKETQAYAVANGSQIIGNICSGTIEGWRALARLVEDCGIPMLEVNYQTPHPKGMAEGAEGIWIAQDPNVTAEVTRQIVDAVNIPVMVKLTPESNRITEIAKAALDAGAASVAVNSRFVGFAVDIEKAEPYIGGPAGVGGPWVKYITQRWVNEIYSKYGCEISGSNGIFDWRDAVEFIMSGAKVMQVGSVLMLKGIEWMPKVIDGINRFLDDHDYPSIAAIHGIASDRSLKTPAEMMSMEPLYCEIDRDKCNYPTCDICIRMCFYDSLFFGEDQVITTPDKCIGCELCFNVCPFDAIRMVPKSERVEEIAAE